MPLPVPSCGEILPPSQGCCDEQYPFAAALAAHLAAAVVKCVGPNPCGPGLTAIALMMEPSLLGADYLAVWPKDIIITRNGSKGQWFRSIQWGIRLLESCWPMVADPNTLRLTDFSVWSGVSHHGLVHMEALVNECVRLAAGESTIAGHQSLACTSANVGNFRPFSGAFAYGEAAGWEGSMTLPWGR
jgi:hypothetical protein